MIIFNADYQNQLFKLPELNGEWKLILDTADLSDIEINQQKIIIEQNIKVSAHTCVVLTFTQINLQQTNKRELN